MPIVIAWLGVVGVLGGLIQGRSYILPGAVVALGIAALVDVVDGSLPIRVAPIMGGGLLACAELGYWSDELRANLRHSTIGVIRRTVVIAGLVLLGTALSALGVELLQRVAPA